MDSEELKRQVQLLKEQADLQAKISGSYSEYIDAVKVYKKTYNEILRNRKLEQALQSKITAAGANATQKDKDRLEILRSQTAEMVTQGKQLRQAIEDTNALTLSAAKLGATLTKGIGNLPGLVNKGIGKLKDLGLLDMEKSIKMSGLQMGLLSKQAVNFRENIKDAAGQTTFIGAGIEDLAKMQSEYSDQIGRAVQLSQESLVAMGRMSKETGLGAEGTAEMVASMDELGVSASRVGDYVNQTMNDAHKMGLNSSKVVKNIQTNIKMLNKYNFKDGIKGLAKMAELSSKLGVKMDFAASMSDKLWDIEGAVDMSAQLQVMGGAWAKMADPFHLMYMARNDMAGLTEEIAGAAAASMHLAKDGSIQMSSMEMSRLKKIAQETGVEYDELITSGKKLFALNKVKSQLNFTMSPDAQAYIAATAEFGQDGKATIMVGADKSIKKFVKDLSSEDIASLEARAKETAAAGERAKQAMNFDEALKNTFDKMKIALLPIVEVLNDKLVPKLEGFVKRWDKEQWGEKIEKFATKIGEVVGFFAGWVIDNPIKSAFIYGATQFGGMIWDVTKWVANGLALATGFNIGASGKGGIGGMLKSLGGGGGAGGALTSIAKVLGPLAAIAGGAAIGGAATEASGRKSTTTGTVIGGLAGAAGWAGAAALAPETFGLSLLVPLIAGGIGKYLGDKYSQPDEPEVLPPAGDTFSFGKGGKTGKGAGQAGYNKNRAIMGPKGITPIPNGESFVSMKKGGAIENALNNNANSPSTINHIFAPLEIKGSIMINTPGNPGKGVELLKDSHFIRQITSMIHVETSKMQNGK
jgi:hypothetical protein